MPSTSWWYMMTTRIAIHQVYVYGIHPHRWQNDMPGKSVHKFVPGAAGSCPFAYSQSWKACKAFLSAKDRICRKHFLRGCPWLTEIPAVHGRSWVNSSKRQFYGRSNEISKGWPWCWNEKTSRPPETKRIRPYFSWNTGCLIAILMSWFMK